MRRKKNGKWQRSEEKFLSAFGCLHCDGTGTGDLAGYIRAYLLLCITLFVKESCLCTINNLPCFSFVQMEKAFEDHFRQLVFGFYTILMTSFQNMA